MTNRFKGLDLIECLKKYGWRFMTLYRRQWSRPPWRKINAKRKNAKRIIEKAREFQKNNYFCFIDYAKAFECVDRNKVWKILKVVRIPDHLTCLLRNPKASEEALQIAEKIGETKESLDESERGEWKSWLKTQHSKDKHHGIQSHHFMANRWANSGNSVRLYSGGL